MRPPRCSLLIHVFCYSHSRYLIRDLSRGFHRPIIKHDKLGKLKQEPMGQAQLAGPAASLSGKCLKLLVLKDAISCISRGNVLQKMIIKLDVTNSAVSPFKCYFLPVKCQSVRLHLLLYFWAQYP